jgi:ParB/RepB/Spo0J family partition protein
MSGEEDGKRSLIGEDSLKSLIEKYKDAGAASALEKSASLASVVSLPLASIKLFPLLNEENYNLDSLTDLEKSIAATEIKIPLFIWLGRGQPYLINGIKRYLSAKADGLKEVPCIYLQGEEEEIILYVLDNIRRNNDNSLVVSYAYKVLEEQYFLKEKDIRELTGLSHGQIANILRISSLASPVKEMVKKGQLTSAKARLLVGLSPADQERLGEKFLTLDVRSCEALARKAKKEPSTSGETQAFTYKVEGQTVTVTDLDPNTIQALINWLEERKKQC